MAEDMDGNLASRRAAQAAQQPVCEVVHLPSPHCTCFVPPMPQKHHHSEVSAFEAVLLVLCARLFLGSVLFGSLT
eukprot:4179603-Amphidinium_carterae.1